MSRFPVLCLVLTALAGAWPGPLPLWGEEDLPPVPDSVSPGDVVFSELMWMGSGASPADEWIELYNRSSRPVGLEGWTITRLQGDRHRVMLRLRAGQIAPAGTFLIANYRAGDRRTRLAVVPDVADAAVALANARLQLALYRGDPGSGGALVDVADDGRGAPLAGSVSPRAAMVRTGLDLDGRRPQAWSTAVEASGWKAGAGERGTPGSRPPPAAPASGGGRAR